MEYVQYVGPVSMALAAASAFFLMGLGLKKSR